MHILGFLRATRLTFVSKQQQNGEVWTFNFAPSKPLNHIAGQHGFFILPGFTGGHPYSLSSAPDEQYVSFTTRVRPQSRHKQRLARMQPGEKMTVLGPVLNFIFKDTTKGNNGYVFLAQGIGITPFRSLLVYANARQLPVTTTLIHVDSNGHTFKDETSVLATKALYPTDPGTFASDVTAVATAQPTAHFYLSGSPKFVSQTKKMLRGMGITAAQFTTDTFFGY